LLGGVVIPTLFVRWVTDKSEDYEFQ
jgi:hypothetical protein